MIPKVDGYVVCQYMKQQEDYSVAKVIFLSPKSKEADIQKGYEMGADLYLTKPFSTRTLMEKIKALQS